MHLYARRATLHVAREMLTNPSKALAAVAVYRAAKHELVLDRCHRKSGSTADSQLL